MKHWLVVVLGILFWLGSTKPAQADNCQSAADCFNSAELTALAIAVIILAIALLAPLWPEIAVAFRYAAARFAAGAARLAARLAARFAARYFAPTIRVAAADDAAVEAAAARAAAARSFNPLNPWEWVGRINPRYGLPGYDSNCSQCVRAVNAALEGKPIPTVVADLDEHYAGLAVRYVSKWQWDLTTRNKVIEEALMAGGEGTRGVVGVCSGVETHVFNGVNIGGKPVFIDGQSGQIYNSLAEALKDMGYFAPNNNVGWLPMTPLPGL